MSDLIDRQAAIDALNCDITITGRQNAELVAATIGVFADRIKALPSAQPEIIYCKDCANAPKCFGDVIMKTRSGANLYCPLTYCSEGKRKNE